MSNNVEHNKIFQDEDIQKWESRELGADPKTAKRVAMPTALKNLLNKDSKENGSGKMQLISIRLPEAMINDLKDIGEKEGMGYQTLTREILRRFVEAENRKDLNKALSENRKLESLVESMREELDQLEKQA